EMRENMKTRIRTVSVATVVLMIGLGVATAGCGKYSFANLKAMKAFKEANEHYRGQRWREAAERYEAVVSNQAALAVNPDLTAAYFFLGHSYDNLYKPARKGEAENDGYIAKAIAAYSKGAELSSDPIYRRRSMEYLVAAYGGDKLNDPGQAEPVVLKIIEMDPSDPSAYFALAQIYEGAGRYDEAEQALLKGRDAKPNDPAVYNALAQYYNRQGEFEKTMDAFDMAAELDPDNPQGYYLISTYYQEKASKDFRLNDAQKREYNEKGLAAAERALKLNPNYVDALVYKGILLLQLARVEKDPAKQKEMVAEAGAARSKAMELQKTGGAAKPAGQ
ncbi:MAG: tetratricopeptide repeat protein, partial [Burkholderiales bacterium]